MRYANLQPDEVVAGYCDVGLGDGGVSAGAEEEARAVQEPETYKQVQMISVRFCG